ncbi:MAG: group 1 glycosyl transferase, partial [Gemmatimonadaceae bacterium]|nr:group 1 glycosyl transferase [Gemmatimonadaceae bacterium]
MTRRLPAVLQVSAADVLGGAERIARQLHEAVRAQGGESWMAVGVVRSGTPGAFPMPNDAYRSAWTRAWARAAARWEAGHDRPSLAVRLARGLVGNPARWLAWRRGHEDFDYPATRALLELPPRRPDLLHLHNLHPQSFDLRELPALS